MVLPADSGRYTEVKAIPHNSKCRYGERGAAAAKPKAQIILDAAKVSAASGGNSEPKQGQRSQSARGFCPRSTMRVPQPDIIEHFGNADAAPHTEPQRGASERNRRLRRLLARRSAGAVLEPLGGNRAVLPKGFGPGGYGICPYGVGVGVLDDPRGFSPPQTAAGDQWSPLQKKQCLPLGKHCFFFMPWRPRPDCACADTAGLRSEWQATTPA